MKVAIHVGKAFGHCEHEMYKLVTSTLQLRTFSFSPVGAHDFT